MLLEGDIMKSKKISLSIIILIIFISSLTLINSNRISRGDILEKQDSLVSSQNNIIQNISDNLDENIHVSLDPFNISPLSALISFKTDMDVSVSITIKGQANSPDLHHEFASSKEHILPIYGLYPDSNNEIIVDKGGVSETVFIKTLPEPSDLESKIESVKDDSFDNLLSDDFYFFTPASKGYTCAYDTQGNLRWYLTEKLVWEIKTLNNGNLLLSNEKLMNPPYYTTGFYELSPLGQIFKEYIVPGAYHHDISELPNGNFIVASDNFLQDTVEDTIVELDRATGDVIKTIDLKEIIDSDSGRSENWTGYDWFHNNSVWYDEKTNSITLSGRHQDIVLNIDYDSLDINYILGDPVNHHESLQKYFLTPDETVEWSYAQHAAKILDNGDLMLFDNGVNRSKESNKYLDANDNYSRGVIYRINQENMTVSQVFEYGKELGSNHYSSYVSDVDALNENHYLIHSGGHATYQNNILNKPPGLTPFDSLKSITTEIINGKEILKLTNPNNYYRAEKMNIYHKDTVEKTNGLTLGKLDSSLVDKERYKVWRNTKDITEVDSDLQLELIRESNRLSIHGNFNKEDDVSIILRQGFKELEYDVRISSKPYTAMCIVIFDDQKQAVTVNINDSELLSGDYAVLIKINNTTYHSQKIVRF